MMPAPSVDLALCLLAAEVVKLTETGQTLRSAILTARGGDADRFETLINAAADLVDVWQHVRTQLRLLRPYTAKGRQTKLRAMAARIAHPRRGRAA